MLTFGALASSVPYFVRRSTPSMPVSAPPAPMITLTGTFAYAVAWSIASE